MNFTETLRCLEPMFKKSDNFKIIQAELIRYAVVKRIIPVIIIDEVNYIKNGILNDLKLLFNFDMDSTNRTVVLLVGLPQINIRQRITINYNLEVLSKEEAIHSMNVKRS